MELSIVIPAYNEAHKIHWDIESAARFLTSRGIEGEIIVADDGSSDRTVAVARQAGEGVGHPVIVETGFGHRGKGYALRRGFARSRGRYAAFVDSGLCVPFEELVCGLDLVRTGQCAIAHGSRKVARDRIARQQSVYRRFCSEAFRLFVHWVMGIPPELTDTQCGFKIYRGEVARELYGQCITDGFTIDIEVILRALRGGYEIREFVIDWSCDPDSRVQPLRSSVKILKELMVIRRTLKRDGNPGRAGRR